MTAVDSTRTNTPPGRPTDRKVVWFPLMWDLTGRKVVVVGGGSTAEDKIGLLVETAAAVTVISPDITDTISTLVDEDAVQWVPREFTSVDLDGATLIIAATDDEHANTIVHAEAEARGIPVNAVDDPARCSVIFPAVHRDGPLVVAVSTSGAAPAVAVRLRDRVAKLTRGYGRWLELLRGFRRQIRTRFGTFAERREVWYRIADSAPALDASRTGDDTTASRLVQEVIDGYAARDANGAVVLKLPTRDGDGSAVERAQRRISEALAAATSPAVTCSMQLGGLVLLDLVRQQEPHIEVVFVDTGYHFPETLDFRDRIAAEWDLNLTVVAADVSVASQEAEYGRLYNADPARCCAIRKVGPAETALADHDLWLAAVRRSQGLSRVDLPISLDHRLSNGKLIRKVHPLADWTWDDIDTYATRRGIPRHPLYEHGYSSIGCAPCTTPTFATADERSGRWDGTEMSECGLHIPQEPGTRL